MRLLPLLALLVCAACTVAPQPDSTRTTAAYEVPLPSDRSKQAFIELLRKQASAFGYHVDAAKPEELRQLSEVSPITMNLAVWRGANDEESVASAIDLPDNLGRIWLSFSMGSDPAKVVAFRKAAMAQVMQRWPDTRSLPVLAGRTIPLPEDLERTDKGYRLKDSAKARYAAQNH